MAKRTSKNRRALRFVCTYTGAMLRYAITDRRRFPGGEVAQQAAVVEQARRLAAEGADFFLLREKDLAAGALAALARRVLVALRPHGRGPSLLIPSRADVAIAVGADGVHLPSAPGSLSPAEVRRLYAGASLPEPIVSVSCHTLAEVARAAGKDPGGWADSPANLILVGPVYEKRIGERRVSPGVGLDLLRAACATAAPVPVLALGGITRENTAACGDAGACGIAAIRRFGI